MNQTPDKPKKDAGLGRRIELRARSLYRDDPRWRARLAADAGLPVETVRTVVKRGRRPSHDTMVALERVLGDLSPIRIVVAEDGESRYEVPAPAPATSKPEHLRREFQRTHTFTMIVAAMWRLEQQSDAGDEAAQRGLRACWDMLHAVRPFVEQVAQWTGDDWKGLLRTDYWRKITRNPEADVERLLERIFEEDRAVRP